MSNFTAIQSISHFAILGGEIDRLAERVTTIMRNNTTDEYFIKITNVGYPESIADKFVYAAARKFPTVAAVLAWLDKIDETSAGRWVRA